MVQCASGTVISLPMPAGPWGVHMSRLPPAMRLLGLGWYVAFCIVMWTVGGVLIDDAANTRPLFTMLGLFLGLLAALLGGYLLLMEALGFRQRPPRKDRP